MICFSNCTFFSTGLSPICPNMKLTSESSTFGDLSMAKTEVCFCLFSIFRNSLIRFSQSPVCWYVVCWKCECFMEPSPDLVGHFKRIKLRYRGSWGGRLGAALFLFTCCLCNVCALCPPKHFFQALIMSGWYFPCAVPLFCFELRFPIFLQKPDRRGIITITMEGSRRFLMLS